MAFTKKIAGWVAGRIKGEQARKDTMRWMEKTGLGMILDAAGDYALTQGALKGAGKLKGLLTGGGKVAGAPLPTAASTAKALPEGVTEVGRMASANPAEARSLTAQMVQPKSLPPMPAPGAGATTLAPRAATAITPPPAPTGVPGATPMRAMVAPGAGATTMAPRTAAAIMAPPSAPSMPSPMAPSAPSPMQAMVAPAAAPAPVPTGGMTGGMTPSMRADLPKFGGYGDVANANMTRGVGGFRGAAQFARENANWLGPAATATGNVIGSAIDRSVEEEKLKREQDAKNRLAMLLMPMFQSQIGQFGQLNPMGSSFQPRG